MGGKEQKEKIALTDEQIKILLEAVKGNEKTTTFCMLCLHAGLRREEALGLKWSEVKLDRDPPTLHVGYAWRRLKGRTEVSSTLKSKAADRIIPIPEPLYEYLKKLRDENPDAEYVLNYNGGFAKEHQWDDLWSYVKTRQTGEHVYYVYKDGKKSKHSFTAEKGQVSKHNPEVTYSIDFDITPHILRHTYITKLVMAGLDIKSVQYLAGHEKATITLDIYTHIKEDDPTSQRAVLEALKGAKSPLF